MPRIPLRQRVSTERGNNLTHEKTCKQRPGYLDTRKHPSRPIPPALPCSHCGKTIRGGKEKLAIHENTRCKERPAYLNAQDKVNEFVTSMCTSGEKFDDMILLSPSTLGNMKYEILYPVLYSCYSQWCDAIIASPIAGRASGPRSFCLLVTDFKKELAAIQQNHGFLIKSYHRGCSTTLNVTQRGDLKWRAFGLRLN